MQILCFDLEGVFVPEIWIAFSEETGIEELKITTREEPDYDKLMKYRMNILREHKLGIREIQAVIEKIDPLPGAVKFLDRLRDNGYQFVIVSDTFTQFAKPLMKKLGYPTLMCNELVIDEDGMLSGVTMRIDRSKYSTVIGLQSIGYDTIAAGDSHNDLDMIKASNAGFLFRTTDAIREANPDIPALETYDELFEHIAKVK